MQLDLKTVLKRYGIDYRECTFSKIKTGYSRLVFKVTTPNGLYVLHYTEAFNRESLVNASYIQRALHFKDIQSPSLISVIDNEAADYIINTDKTVTLSQWVEGVHLRHASPPDAYKLGRALAVFHTSLPDMEYDNTGAQLLDAAFDPWLARRSSFYLHKNASQLVTSLKGVVFNNLPSGSVHGDYHLNNILFNDDALYVLDFERSGRGVWLLDVTRAVIGTCMLRGRIDQVLNAAFLNGYESIRKLEANEQKLYKHALMYAAAAMGDWFSTHDNVAMSDQFLAAGFSVLKKIPYTFNNHII